MNAPIDKIRKLLELSKSSNEYEAALAATRAAELMLQHQIAAADLEAAGGPVEPDEPIVEEAIDSDGKVVHWHSVLVWALADSMGAQGLQYRGTGWTDAKYTVIGPPSTIAAVRYTYQYLTREINRLADSAFRLEVEECRRSSVSPPSARAWKAAFRVGAAEMVGNRLRAQRADTMAQARSEAQQLENRTTALAIVDRKREAVKTFIKEKHGRLRSGGGSSAGQGSRSGYQAGQAAGRGIGLGGGARLGSGQGRLRS